VFGYTYYSVLNYRSTLSSFLYRSSVRPRQKANLIEQSSKLKGIAIVVKPSKEAVELGKLASVAIIVCYNNSDVT